MNAQTVNMTEDQNERAQMSINLGRGTNGSSCVFGIIAGWLFWRTRSLIPGMIIHIVNNSSAVILEKICPDYEPSKLICMLMIVVFLPILLFGLKWFNRGGYQSRFL